MALKKTPSLGFELMMSLSTMSLGDRFCTRQKGATGEDGWVHPGSEISMAMFGLDWRSLGWHQSAISFLSGWTVIGQELWLL